MNREPNKEIDILLRKLSKKQNGNLAVDGDLAAAAEEHLDADELNAYAEQALPPALRARYTEHLADCGRCRSIVTQLSQSSPVVISHEIVDQPAPSWLKTFLASLFSPMVMRYAVPAMAVILVAAIAWIAVRRPARSVDLAQTTARQSESVAPLQDRAPLEQTTNERTEAATADAKQKRENKQSNVSGDEAPATTATGSKATEEVKEAEERAKRDEPAPPPAAPQAAAPSSAAPSSATGAVAAAKPVNQADKNEPAHQKKIESDVAKAQPPAEQESRPYARAQKAGPSPPAKITTQSAETKTNESVSAARRERAAEERQKDEARDDDAETRTVAGHRFKRRGSVWTDVLYDSNRSTVNVSRGSEQYRVLVGDEPGLRTIADQLSGTVIVVWKNRAYRIR